MDLHRTVIAESELGCNTKHSNMLVDLTLQEIVNAGGVTNPYQLFVLGHLSEFFKNGLKSVDLHLETPFSFNTNATSTEVKSSMQALSPEEQVKLASYLLTCIKVGECMLHDKNADFSAWVNFVLGKQ